METQAPNGFKLNKAVQNLIKLGLNQDLATIVACANNKCPEKAEDVIINLREEQQEIMEALKQFVKFDELCEQ